MQRYIGQVFFPLKYSFLRLVSGAEHPATRELWQGDMQLELGDYLLDLLVQVPKLAVAQLGDLGTGGDFVPDFNYVDDLAI